jgi:hypothetical protein
VAHLIFTRTQNGGFAEINNPFKDYAMAEFGFSIASNTSSVTVSSATQTLTIPNGTGKYIITLNHSVTFTLNSGTDGQIALLELIQGSGGGFTVAFGASVVFGTDIAAFTASTTAALVDYVLVQYSSDLSAWTMLAYARGY